MCITCGFTTVSSTKAAEEAAKMQMASGIANVGAAFIGNILNGLCGSTSLEPQSQVPEKPETEEVKEEKPEDPKKNEDNVKQLLGETKFNRLTDEVKSEVLKKYSAIKTYSENNGIEISDAEMTRRLTNYIKALESHKQELQMGEYFINGGDSNSYTGGSIVDEDVKQQKATGTDEQYFQAILDRGNGSVQLYDTNGDNLVTKEEFIAGEAADWKKLTGEDLTDEMRAASEKYFDKMNKDNNNYLDSAEFGAHEYARATLGDTDKNTNEELTYQEWYLGSEVGSNENITKRYDYASNLIYEHLRKQDDATSSL